MEITQKELKRQLKYNSKTGIFTWKIQKSNRIKIGDIAGTKHKKGYIQISLDKIYKAHRLAWLYEYGYLPENGLDHKDRINYHNWISNLREASKQCNARNTGNPKDNTSGVKGVSWNKQYNKWRTVIGINQKQIHIGNFNDFNEAVCYRLAAEQCINWSGCDSSSPAYKYVKENII